MGYSRFCERCSGTGFIIGPPVNSDSTAGRGSIIVESIKCKKCDGTGKYDDDSMIIVPKRAVKEEYWNE